MLTKKSSSQDTFCPQCGIKNPPKRHPLHCPKANRLVCNQSASSDSADFRVRAGEAVEYRTDSGGGHDQPSVRLEEEHLMGSLSELNEMVHIPPGRRS